MEENNGVGVSLTREGKTLMISNNPYYYNQMIELKADGPTQQAVPSRASCDTWSIYLAMTRSKSCR